MVDTRESLRQSVREPATHSQNYGQLTAVNCSSLPPFNGPQDFEVCNQDVQVVIPTPCIETEARTAKLM
jgi:hypothetical protein